MSTVAVERIALATDFGYGPYAGQMRLRLHSMIPNRPVIDLVHDLPAFRPDLAAYLLPALLRDLPPATLYLCIVDPGVGGQRGVLLIGVGGSWLMGPDNGILSQLARQAGMLQRLDWRPQRMSNSFHGRDLFLPLAVRLIEGEDVGVVSVGLDEIEGSRWPEQCASIIYRDHYGNLMTGLCAGGLSREMRIRAGRHRLANARTFCEAPIGAGFWYENAFGLVELAVNQGRADRVLGLEVGGTIELDDDRRLL